MKNFSASKNWQLEASLIALFGVLAALIFFIHLGDYPLFNPDEGLYAEPAREMLDTGEYITTTLNYAIRFTKPPLVIWAMALGYKFFGINEFAARFFSATSGFLLIIVTYLFTNKYLGRRTAAFCAVILLTSPLFIGVGRMAITDMPLSLFTAGSLFAFFHGWKQKQFFWILIAYVLTAFAIMTKGPVGLLLPIVILSTFFYLRGQLKNAFQFFRIPVGVFLVGLIALPWFVIEIAVTHGAYFQEFIMRENFARFTSVVDAHKGPWWYHIAAIFGGLFPWSILLPQALFTIFNNFRTTASFTNPSKINFAAFFSKCLITCKSLENQDEVLLFAILSSIIIIGFFSASVSKLLPYTLPAFPALAIIVAYQCSALLQNKSIKNTFIYLFLFTTIYAIAAFLCPLFLKHLRNSPIELISVLNQYTAVLGCISLLSIVLLACKRQSLSLASLFAGITIITIFFIPQLLSVLSQSWEQTAALYARFARLSHKPFIVYRLRKPSLPFYYRQQVLQPANIDELKNASKDNQPYYLITSNKYLPEVESLGYKLVDQGTNYSFLVFSK